MATKTFKTRIKLKYDSAAKWRPEGGTKFQGLAGELLIGSDDKYLRIGNGTGWDFAKISGTEVNITGYSIGNETFNTADAAIANLNSRINNITDGGVVTLFGGKTGAITVAGPLSMNGNQLTIATATDSKLGVVKVTTDNGLAISDGTIAMGLASASAAGAMSAAQYTKLVGIDDGAEVNVIESVKVNGAGLTTDNNRAVNITITEGTENGKIAVNGTGVAVHGLGSAAYTNSDAYQAKFTDGSATVATLSDNILTLTSVTQSGGVITNGDTITTLTFAGTPTKTNKIVTQSEISGIVGAMVYKGTLGTGGDIQELPGNTEGTQGHVYVVKTDGTYNEKTAQVGDMFVSNGTAWDLIQGNVNVTNNGAALKVGEGAANIATVEGVTITASVTAAADKVAYGVSSNVRAALDSLNAAVATTLPNSIGEISDNTIIGDEAIIIPDNTTVGSDSISITHVTHEPADVAAVKVGKDQYGHVKIGDALTATDIFYESVQGETVGSALDGLKNKDNDHDTKINTNTAAINTLNGDVNTAGSVAHSINTIIKNLDSNVTAGTDTTDSAPSADFKVLQKVVIDDGKLVPTASAHVGLKKLATTANVNDLIQTDGDYIIFDCGSASSVINPED